MKRTAPVPSSGKAEAHLRHLEREGRRNMHVYFCGDCGSWHVGHKEVNR